MLHAGPNGRRRVWAERALNRAKPACPSSSIRPLPLLSVHSCCPSRLSRPALRSLCFSDGPPHCRRLQRDDCLVLSAFLSVTRQSFSPASLQRLFGVPVASFDGVARETILLCSFRGAAALSAWSRCIFCLSAARLDPEPELRHGRRSRSIGLGVRWGAADFSPSVTVGGDG